MKGPWVTLRECSTAAAGASGAVAVLGRWWLAFQLFLAALVIGVVAVARERSQ